MIASLGALENQSAQEHRFQNEMGVIDATRAQLLDLGGPSLCYYFDFVKSLAILNFFMLLLIPWWPSSTVRGILVVLMPPIFGITLFIYAYKCRPVEAGPGLRASDASPDRAVMAPSFWRLGVSSFLFLAVISVYAVVQAAIQNQIGATIPSIRSIAMILAIAHVLFKQMWRFLCFVLTKWERHNSEETHRRSNLLKLLVYDWTSYFVYFATQAAILFKRLPKSTCYSTVVREQHLTLLLSDLLLGNVIELAYTWVYNAWSTRNVMYLPKADDAYRLEFDLAEEYAECLFRQFLIIMGCLVSPWPSLAMGIGSHFIEFWVDRLKLIRFCQPPTYSRSDFRHLIALSQICTGLLALGLYPAGFLWLTCQ